MKIKRIGMLVLLITMFTGIIGASQIVSAKDNEFDSKVYALSFMKSYSDTLLDEEVNKIMNYFDNNNETNNFINYLLWRVEIIKRLDVGYQSHNFVITQLYETNKDNLLYINIVTNEEFTYANGAGDGGAVNLEYNLVLNLDDHKIVDIITSDDYFISYDKKFANSISNFKLNRGLNDEVLDELSELQENLQSADLIDSNLTYVEQIGMAPFATSYSYNATRASQYALKYWQNYNSAFYEATADCTNFASQCIWAGYGGWSATMSNSTMVSNITNKVRMVSNVWHGGSGGGMSNWENVDYLWDYATGKPSIGPKANGYNNGKTYSSLAAYDIRTGDVLQFSYDGSDYYHSIFVASAPADGQTSSFSLITVVQHSGPNKRTLSEAIAQNGNYLRHMQFVLANFNS